MVTLKKEITLTPSIKLENDELTILLNTCNSNYKSMFDNSTITDSYPQIKNNELICLFLDIINPTSSSVTNLKLNIIDDNILELIPSSLINLQSKETLLYNYINNTNIFLIPKLASDEKLSLKLFAKIHLDKLDLSSFGLPLPILCPISSNCENILDTAIIPLQSVLNINISPSGNSIKFENVGSDSCNNIIYNYTPPQLLNYNINNLKYTFENLDCNVTAINLNNTILFRIDSLPESTNTKPKRLKIELTPNSNDYFLNAKFSLK